jgi:OTU-like cysteine protease
LHLFKNFPALVHLLLNQTAQATRTVPKHPRPVQTSLFPAGLGSQDSPNTAVARAQRTTIQRTQRVLRRPGEEVCSTPPMTQSVAQHRAAAQQQDLGQGATSLQQPHPQPAASQSQPAAWAQSQAVASSDSPPSQSLPPFEQFPDSDDDSKMNDHSPLSLIDSTNHTTAGSTFDGLKIIPNIAPPQMFPSLTAIGKTAISMKANGSCLFHALADQICHDPDQVDEVREAVVNFMADTRDVFKAMLPLNDIHDSQSKEFPLSWEENAQLDEYLRLLAKKGVWGEEPEIHAAAQYFGVTIVVHQDNGSFFRYNEDIGGNTAHIGYSRQYDHYYSAKGNDQVFFDGSNLLANGAKPDWESQVSLATHASKVAIRFLLGSSYRFSYAKAAEGCSAVQR